MDKINWGQIFKKLKPKIEDLIIQKGGGAGPYAPSPHSLSSDNHTGTLVDAQFPQGLLRDGSRSLTGNLLVEEGIAIDGVDISILGSDFSTHILNDSAHHNPVSVTDTGSINLSLSGQGLSAAVIPGGVDHNALNNLMIGDPHTQYLNSTRHTLDIHTDLGLIHESRTVNAGAGLIGGGDLSEDRILDIGAGSGISVSVDAVALDEGYSPIWTGNHIFRGNTTTRHILPESTDTYNLGDSAKKWRKAWVSELDAVVFAEQTQTLIGGWFTVGKQSGVIDTEVGISTSQIDFGQSMTVNDFVLFRSGLNMEYMQITSLVSGTIYNVSRNIDGSGANSWPAGSVYLVLGNSGDGRVELSAIDGPKIQVFDQGSSYNDQAELVRIGDLNASYGITSQKFGFAAGNFNNGDYIRYTDDDGLVFSAGGGGVLLDEDGITLSGYGGTIKDCIIRFETGYDNLAKWYTSMSASRNDVYLINQSTTIPEGIFSISTKSRDEAGVTLYAEARDGASVYATSLRLVSDGVNHTKTVFIGGTLDLSGNIVQNVNEVVADLGSASDPSFTFDGQTTDGIYHDGTSLAISHNSAKRASFNTEIDFHVNLDMNSKEINNVTVLRLSNEIQVADGTVGDPSITFGSDGNTGIYRSASDQLAITTGGTASHVFDTNNFYYTSNLKPYRNGTSYNGYVFVPLTTPMTSTSFDGDLFPTRGKTKIDLSASFGLPAGIKAIAVRVGLQCAYSGSNDSIWMAMDPGSGSNRAFITRASGMPNNYYNDNFGIVACDSNGDVYYETSTGGTGTTLKMWIQITGYWI